MDWQGDGGKWKWPPTYTTVPTYAVFASAPANHCNIRYLVIDANVGVQRTHLSSLTVWICIQQVQFCPCSLALCEILATAMKAWNGRCKKCRQPQWVRSSPIAYSVHSWSANLDLFRLMIWESPPASAHLLTTSLLVYRWTLLSCIPYFDQINQKFPIFNTTITTLSPFKGLPATSAIPKK